MHTLRFSSAQRFSRADRKANRLAPLCVIVLVHAGILYALQSGLLQRAVPSLKHEVFATLIASPQPAQAKPPAMPSVPRHAMPRENLLPQPIPLQSSPAATSVSIAPAPAPVTSATATPALPSTAVETVEATTPKTVSSGVEYLQPPQPEYPAIARRMHEEGKVVMRVLVNENGRAEHIELQQSSGSLRLDEAARLALLRAVFKPYRENGKTVAVYAIVPIRFQLDT